MKLTMYQVDAFADRLFAGNPAAVIVTRQELPADLMQAIAAENNLAETAFAVRGDKGMAIRWFTPTLEVDLCGHATLAASHVLFRHLGEEASQLTFCSRSGPLHVRLEDELLYLDFPVDHLKPVAASSDLLEGLGAQPVEIWRGRDDHLAIFDSEDTVAQLQPRMSALARVPSRGVIASAAGRSYDFVSRFFGPRAGVPEDPVTGSAHTTLTPYWANKLGKNPLRARQISSRGGDVHCRLVGDRVVMGGKAVTYLVGEIAV